ncbi:MAG TPA: WG repeat-containing protein, partial [Pilimelia sp.]|nr:WG repeat-containing protein [Pilimelia sp.]
TGPPATNQPATSQPPTGEPETSQPTASQPTTSQPTTSQPERARPAAVAAGPPPPAPDPEQQLSAYRWRFHHDTLRELVEDPDELRAVRDRLTGKLAAATDNAARARLLSLRAVVSRILGDLGRAHSDGKLALAHAEATGELRRVAIAQARLAHVHQWRGEFAEADRLFELANSTELPDRLRATMHEHAGRSAYDQGRYMEACNHFDKALDLRKVQDPDLIARTELALDAVYRKVAENGWGPYPRTRDEVLQVQRPPAPAFDDRFQCWGYADAAGKVVVPPAYAEVQPFRDGVAWVRRPEAYAWELIDASGSTLIDASAGYLGVGSFAEGLAWVSVDGARTWIAIDKANTVVIATGFEDVRPFRRGIAAVRRGGWGAVDAAGRVVVPLRYAAFATALTDGRYLDGFTDEGLAIVDAGGRRGVVDRTGRVLVPPSYGTLVIHPVAFLFTGPDGRWGALDRRGEALIPAEQASRTAVLDEIDRLLADTKPVL